MAKYRRGRSEDSLEAALDDLTNNPPATIMQEEVDTDPSLASKTVEEMNPFETVGTDVLPMDEKVKSGVIAAMDGTVDELHAVQVRLAEIVPFLSGAIAKATGETKAFLQSLSDQL